MTGEPGNDDVQRTFRAYEQSGYSRRWEGTTPGDRAALAERDRWLVEVVGVASVVVDLGCGNGNLGLVLDAVGQRPDRYIGIDLLPERVATARDRVPWGEFYAGSADRLPLDTGSVDVAAALVLLSSVREPEQRRAIFTEVRRVLRPGGRFVVYDIRLPSPRNPAVRPLDMGELIRAFPGWQHQARTLTVLPPLARSVVVRGDRTYRWLARLPALRSHVGLVLTAK